MSKNMLDNIDKMIIAILQEDGRTPLSHIGEKTGISHVAVRKRLDKLLGEKLISISTCINVEATNARIAAVLVEVENSRRLKELVNMFKDCPRTIFMTGLSASNLLAIIMGENLSTLESIIGICSLRAQKGIRRSEVYIGSSPVHPQFLPVRVFPHKEAEIAPCGAKCSLCDNLLNKQCLGCPSTRFYEGQV
ncbi:Lrp/AsnC family transcriptional regulator [Candidatus Bathyarchaeota archaeon]|nr:Lrp/AsnC family transcriptional regulator [Candidatus Bathyarchaeota archaeon]MBS7629458.1 Lrp/AsnC family transcriptional regulator [Candidatus Bathyarchaeota archaeon]